jgi:23S rRNA (cytidine1920-2'-O)/16S rRNA (cytidine1409-2'-O)-methyltransferase
MKSPARPLWQRLVESGEFTDRKQAGAWIMAGNVYVDGERIDKAGTTVRDDAEVTVKGREIPYVGRGGLKLEGALESFRVDVTGMVTLDTGASTGGFTDCLIRRGARCVYAVDAGYGQLAGSLRNDSRVINMERTNISDVHPRELRPPPSLATVDLSYLSLRKAIPIVHALLSPPKAMICLVKPLFETENGKLRRIGRIDDPKEYETVLRDLTDFSRAQGRHVHGVSVSPIRGNKGTREFFLLISDDSAFAPVPGSEELGKEIERITLNQ